MDNKILLQDLVLGVSLRSGSSKKDSETFVRTFFDLIEEFLLKDKIVKVKGLGTFKVVEVSGRDSVDVNSGERIHIKGHSKITFTPDSTIRDQVNRPFADFETVILNEGVDISSMEDVSQNLSLDQPQDDLFQEKPVRDFNTQEDSVQEKEKMQNPISGESVQGTNVQEDTIQESSVQDELAQKDVQEPTAQEEPVQDSSVETHVDEQHKTTEMPEDSLLDKTSKKSVEDVNEIGSTSCENSTDNAYDVPEESMAEAILEVTPETPKVINVDDSEPVIGNNTVENIHVASNSVLPDSPDELSVQDEEIYGNPTQEWLKRLLYVAVLVLCLGIGYWFGSSHIFDEGCGVVVTDPVHSVEKPLAERQPTKDESNSKKKVLQDDDDTDNIKVGKEVSTDSINEKGLSGKNVVGKPSAKEEKLVDSDNIQKVENQTNERKTTDSREVALKEAEKYPQLQGGEYLITGVQKVHSLRRGESVNALAQKYYGDLHMGVYISKLNNLKNPDVVEVGQKLKIPVLTKK